MEGRATVRPGARWEYSRRPRGDFRSGFFSLVIEAYRRSKISRGKLHELGRLVEAPETEIDHLLDRLGFLDDEKDDEILLPGD